MQAGTKRALLIGINYYGSECQLSGCLDDIADAQSYLEKHGFTEFRVLKDDSKDPEHKNPDCPTRANILAAIREMIAKTKDGDYLYFHYSGHGSYVSDDGKATTIDGIVWGGKDERDGRDEVICPVDYDTAGMIKDDELHILMVRELKPKAKLRCFFDSCHSGSVLDLPFRYSSGDSLIAENNDVSDKDVLMISGCLDAQTSADANINGHFNGAMTWSLFSALREISQMGKYAKTYRWKDLLFLMRHDLRKGGYDQVPQLDFCNKAQTSEIVDLL
jgi:hypothetical protein